MIKPRSTVSTGVNALLSYRDIDAIIAFVNSPAALQPADGDLGQLSVGDELNIHTNILVDSQIPPLFGYQPYDEDTETYVLYQGAADPVYPQGVHSQSFRRQVSRSSFSGCGRPAVTAAPTAPIFCRRCRC
jgi:hypothetical protein